MEEQKDVGVEVTTPLKYTVNIKNMTDYPFCFEYYGYDSENTIAINIKPNSTESISINESYLKYFRITYDIYRTEPFFPKNLKNYFSFTNINGVNFEITTDTEFSYSIHQSYF